MAAGGARPSPFILAVVYVSTAFGGGDVSHCNPVLRCARNLESEHNQSRQFQLGMIVYHSIHWRFYCLTSQTTTNLLCDAVNKLLAILPHFHLSYLYICIHNTFGRKCMLIEACSFDRKGEGVIVIKCVCVCICMCVGVFLHVCVCVVCV